MQTGPRVLVIAGPNGAGKSTLATRLVPPNMAFVNADEIAKTLTTHAPAPALELGGEGGSATRVDVQAARIALARMDELAAARADFALETTLASRTLKPRLERLQAAGWEFTLIFVWVPSADVSIARVAERVRLGGHDIPEDVIRRRYRAGLRNFFQLYQPIADRWRLVDNTEVDSLVTIARGIYKSHQPELWQRLRKDNR